jgi:hypothetical protein
MHESCSSSGILGPEGTEAISFMPEEIIGFNRRQILFRDRAATSFCLDVCLS